MSPKGIRTICSREKQLQFVTIKAADAAGRRGQLSDHRAAAAEQRANLLAAQQKTAAVAAMNQAIGIAGLATPASPGETGREAGAQSRKAKGGGHSNLNLSHFLQ